MGFGSRALPAQRNLRFELEGSSAYRANCVTSSCRQHIGTAGLPYIQVEASTSLNYSVQSLRLPAFERRPCPPEPVVTIRPPAPLLIGRRASTLRCCAQILDPTIGTAETR